MSDTKPLRDQLTLSVISHGHGDLLMKLMSDLSKVPGIDGTTVIVTLNLQQEVMDLSRFTTLALVVHRNPSPLGFGANHNRAFESCRTPWFCILNPDLRFPEPSCFATLLAFGGKHPSVAVIAPKVVGPTQETEDSVRENLTVPSLLVRALRGRRSIALAGNTIFSQRARFRWLAGMFLLVRSEVYDAVGGFDERYFLYCEDYDLCARVVNAGHELAVVTEVRVLHDARRDSRRSLRYSLLHLGSLSKVWRSSAFWRLWLQQTVRGNRRLG